MSAARFNDDLQPLAPGDRVRAAVNVRRQNALAALAQEAAMGTHFKVGPGMRLKRGADGVTIMQKKGARGRGGSGGGILPSWYPTRIDLTHIAVEPGVFNDLPVITGLTLASGSTTSGSPTVTVADTAGMWVGMAVIGVGIPASATVAGITNATTFTLSANATATSSGNNYRTGLLVDATVVNHVYLHIVCAPTIVSGWVTDGVFDPAMVKVFQAGSLPTNSNTNRYLKLFTWQAGALVSHLVKYNINMACRDDGTRTSTAAYPTWAGA